ncbi:MAG: hypothetical protein ACXVBW_05350 [Bdellovibrionota bacterium]
MALFQRDLSKLEENVTALAIYEVKTTGRLPPAYHQSVKNKLERVLLTSKKLGLKDCRNCQEARLIKTEDGQVRYEAYSTDNVRMAKIANDIGAGTLLFAEESYTPEDLQLRVRAVSAESGKLEWSKEYSTADVTKTREGLNDAGPDELGHRDALANVVIGEIAFTFELSPGMDFLPSIDGGGGYSLTTMPALDLFIGEKFDRGRKAFGFLLGAALNPGIAPASGTPLTFIAKIAPQFRYCFNPTNVTTARWSLLSELGAMIAPGMATAYAGIGPEITMIRRFSIGVSPIYILPANVASSSNLTQGSDGSFTPSTSSVGKFGGFGILTRVSVTF